MSDYYFTLFNQYKSKGLLLDSNLLLLLVYLIGQYNVALIGQSSRTRTFSVEDYQLLSDIIDYFDNIVTTPNISTEVSNLSGLLSQTIRDACFKTFAKQALVWQEIFVETSDVVNTPLFKKFGLTDAVIADVAAKEYLVMTADFPLSGYLEKANIAVVNFNHIRGLNWPA